MRINSFIRLIATNHMDLDSEATGEVESLNNDWRILLARTDLPSWKQKIVDFVNSPTFRTILLLTHGFVGAWYENKVKNIGSKINDEVTNQIAEKVINIIQSEN